MGEKVVEMENRQRRNNIPISEVPEAGRTNQQSRAIFKL